jgi:hypothetical protein
MPKDAIASTSLARRKQSYQVILSNSSNLKTPRKEHQESATKYLKVVLSYKFSTKKLGQDCGAHIKKKPYSN